jgi:hypothetical protein
MVRAKRKGKMKPERCITVRSDNTGWRANKSHQCRISWTKTLRALEMAYISTNKINSDTTINLRNPPTWLYPYSRNFVTRVELGPRGIKEPITLCHHHRRVSPSVMNGSTIVSQVEKWLTGKGYAGVRTCSSVFFHCFCHANKDFSCYSKLNRSILQVQLLGSIA